MSDFDTATAPPPPPSGAPAQEDRTMALITHLLGIITCFVGPLIIWLINKDNAGKSFVNDQAKEALNFQITIVIAYVVASIAAVITLGLLSFLPLLVWLANLILCILAGVKANEGVAYRYPFALRLIK